MATIAIYGFDERQTADLNRLLQSRGHRVLDLQPGLNGGSCDGRIVQGSDVFVVQVSGKSTTECVSLFCKLGIMNAARPMILAVCPKYCGAQFELELETKGLRVVYA